MESLNIALQFLLKTTKVYGQFSLIQRKTENYSVTVNQTAFHFTAQLLEI
jgi:hypothetical protein